MVYTCGIIIWVLCIDLELSLRSHSCVVLVWIRDFINGFIDNFSS